VTRRPTALSFSRFIDEQACSSTLHASIETNARAKRIAERIAALLKTDSYRRNDIATETYRSLQNLQLDRANPRGASIASSSRGPSGVTARNRITVVVLRFVHPLRPSEGVPGLVA